MTSHRGTACCVHNCKSYSRFHRDLVDKKISFSVFPNDVALKEEWIARIQLSFDMDGDNQPRSSKKLRWQPKKYSAVCGLHFNHDGKRKYEDKVPIYIGNYVLPKNIFISDIVVLDSDPKGILMEIGAEVELGSKVSMQETSPVKTIVKNKNNLQMFHLEHPYSSGINIQVNELRKQLDLIRINEKKLQQDLMESEKSIVCLRTENAQLKIQLQRLQEDVKKKESESQNNKFRLENVSKSDKMLRFYTGFSCLEDLNILYRQIEPALPNVSLYSKGGGYIRSTERNESSRGRPMVIEFKDQLFLTLCKLRVGLLNQDLAYRFQISLTSVSNYITTWLDLLYRKLTIIPIWPSRQVINEYMPNEFKEKFPTTRVIIDCTEFFIERPSDYGTQCDTYSNYKRHTTAKALIGATPNGFISFISPLAPGRESDVEITAKSGLLEKLEKGDMVLADRGFLIHDLLAAKGVDLNIPPFLGGRKQLSLSDEVRTREIANVRIHIERVIKEIKSFRILKFTFPNSMHASLEKIWYICCYLQNFINEPLLDRKECPIQVDMEF